MLERGRSPLSNYFPLWSGLGVTVNHYRQEEIRWLVMRKNHTEDFIHSLGHFYLALAERGL